mmetsp:Transcript_25612/g.43618  ORF Transcript_25612/g.43618 Transcript_25612/m.43618 type:complete len:261 (+) Transcript_25612:1405-2187(+)
MSVFHPLRARLGFCTAWDWISGSSLSLFRSWNNSGSRWRIKCSPRIWCSFRASKRAWSGVQMCGPTPCPMTSWPSDTAGGGTVWRTKMNKLAARLRQSFSSLLAPVNCSRKAKPLQPASKCPASARRREVGGQRQWDPAFATLRPSSFTRHPFPSLRAVGPPSIRGRDADWGLRTGQVTPYAQACPFGGRISVGRSSAAGRESVRPRRTLSSFKGRLYDTERGSSVPPRLRLSLLLWHLFDGGISSASSSPVLCFSLSPM